MGPLLFFFLSSFSFGLVMGYIPLKDHYLSADFLKEVVDRMGKDLSEAADSYLEFPESNRLNLNKLMANRVVKDIENEEISFPMDYDPLGENPSPSLRDQEYLQQSSLWGHQFVAGGAGEGKQRLKPDGSIKNQQQIKTDASLPAYCNPPNPCPVGYSEDDGCIEEFENTAAFSRDYQSSQDCMCDNEHMFDCPPREYGSSNNQLDLDGLMGPFTGPEQHKNMVAKKFVLEKDENPFLKGEKLPVAAKKGSKIIA